MFCSWHLKVTEEGLVVGSGRTSGERRMRPRYLTFGEAVWDLVGNTLYP